MNSPRFSEQDKEYIEREFISLQQLCEQEGKDLVTVRSQITAGMLPQPAYVMDGGVEMVADDYFMLLDDAGSLAEMKTCFCKRYVAAGGQQSEAEEEWEGYLTGEYAVCLRQVTPEHIVAKASAMTEIEKCLTTEPLPLEQLHAAVDMLDSLERQFAEFDRQRFGGSVSRDRLITAVREKYPRR